MRRVSVLLLLVCTAGCASVTKGTTQTISIATPHADAAKCTLLQGKLGKATNTYYVTTPGSVTVERSRHPIEVRCNKEGYAEAKTIVDAEFEEMTLGNALIGGLVGLTIDAASGAVNEYPQLVSVPMQLPLEDPESQPEPQANLIKDPEQESVVSSPPSDRSIASLPGAVTSAESAVRPSPERAVDLRDGRWTGETADWKMRVTMTGKAFKGSGFCKENRVAVAFSGTVSDRGDVVGKGRETTARFAGYEDRTPFAVAGEWPELRIDLKRGCGSPTVLLRAS